MIGGAVVAHRVREAAGLLEIIIAPSAKFRDAVLFKESRRACSRGQLPQRGLGAILAEFGGMGMLGLGPGARNAHEPARLVLPRQCFEGHRRRPLLAEDARDPL